MKQFYLYLISILKVFGIDIIRKVEFAIFRVKWAKSNTHNLTKPAKCFPIHLVSVGEYSYGLIDVYPYYADGEGLTVGKYCSIAKGVKFILGGNHNIKSLMTFPVRNKFVDSHMIDSYTKGRIVLEDDVWIGVGVRVLSGVRLGQGCVVAAGSVVTKSFPPFSVIGGNPAKIIKMRFSEDVIVKLVENKIVVGDFSRSFILDNIELFNDDLNSDNADQIILNYRKSTK